MKTYNVYQKGPKKGQPKTLTDRVIRFLIEGLNRQELPYDRSRKYRLFTTRATTISGKVSQYWVGKAGAVRTGQSPSNSISMTSQVHANMKMWESKNKKEDH